MRKTITMIYHILSKNEYSYYRDIKKQERKLKSCESFMTKTEKIFEKNIKRA